MLTINKDASVTSNGEDFFIWKKEICSIAIEDENGTEVFGKFQRLEFYELCDQDLVIDWLEPVIHNNSPALVLHCTKKE